MEAAFFDLDKTVIAKAAMMAFGPSLHRAGYLNRWLLVRAVWAQIVFRYFGADEARMVKMRETALRLCAGWEQARIAELVDDALSTVIDPIVYDEALTLIDEHRRAGRRVYLVSASPEEIVVPLARHLGVDGAIATRAEIDTRGRYTGAVEFYNAGANKVTAIEDEAARRGIDLNRSWAYSDSITDLPLLEAVGHPVAVNPDRALQRVARERGWEILTFVHPRPLRRRVRRVGPPVAGVGTLTATAAALAWWWRLRRTGRRRRGAGPLRPRGSCGPAPRRGRPARRRGRASWRSWPRG